MRDRVAVPEDVAKRIRDLVQEYLGRPEKTDLHSLVQTIGALPVYRDMGGTFFLRPDGEILSCEHDQERPPGVEQDVGWRVKALVVAAEKFPELAVLLPDRPFLAKDCRSCEGKGRVAVPEIERSFFCEKCHGLGWLGAAV